MSSAWRSYRNEERGTYTTVAQTEEASAELSIQGHGLDHGDAQDLDVETWTVKQPRRPTREELAELPRVADKLPYSVFLVAIVELCERFAYYGLSGPFQNYIANAYHDANGLPGALGRGQSGATAYTNLFQFWCYLTPTAGAIVADQYLGKYVTIKWFSVVYMIGILILFLTSLPWSIENGMAFPGLMTAMVVIGLGTGGIKSNVSPLIAEQVRSTEPFVKTLHAGRRVIVDPEITVQRIYMMFYMCINLGSVSAIATTMLELHVGFWSAYLLPLMMFCIGYGVLVSGKKQYVMKPPQGGVIAKCLKVVWIAMENGGDLEKAKRSCQQWAKRKRRISWDDEFVDEVKSALAACKVFLFFPMYWVTYSQMMNNFVSQAGQMQLHGLPNDILPNIDPVTIICLIPLLDRVVYPLIRTRLRIAFTPMTRITLGFFMAALAMLYAGGLQSVIYSAPPCYSSPSKCEAGKIDNGKFNPNEVHIAWQTPAYVLIALSEILASITGLELAYARAPENMKSFIMSLFLLTSAGGSVLGIVIAPLARDPYLQWLYFGLAGAAAITGYVFHCTFKDMDVEDQKPVESAADIELVGRREEQQ